MIGFRNFSNDCPKRINRRINGDPRGGCWFSLNNPKINLFEANSIYSTNRDRRRFKYETFISKIIV